MNVQILSSMVLSMQTVDVYIGQYERKLTGSGKIVSSSVTLFYCRSDYTFSTTGRKFHLCLCPTSGNTQ